MAVDGEKALKQLISDLLLEVKLRKYLTVEEKIANQEHIFFDCPSFFILIHLKIRCIYKQIMDLIRLSKENSKFCLLQIDRCISRAKEELVKLIELSQESSVAQFEIVTRLYLEFAYINSIIAKRKNDMYDCLAFTCHALNLMKIFLQRVPYPNEIRTYYYYLLNMLFVSELLIEDSAYETAKMYQFNCLQIAVQALCLINNEDMLYHPYFNKIIETISITLIHRGICNENLSNYKQALEDHKQSMYFSSFLDREDSDMFLYELCSKVREVAFNTFGDAIEKTIPIDHNMQITRNTVTSQNDKMFHIVNGFSFDINKVRHKEKDIEKKLFNNKSNQKDYLLQFVDDHIREYKHFSPETKSNLSHYSLYSKLLSSNYKDFVAMTSNFEYDNPKKQKENIEMIERYINSKIEANVNNNNNNSTETPNNTPLQLNINIINNTNNKNISNSNSNSNWFSHIRTPTNTHLNSNTNMTSTQTNINSYYDHHPINNKKYIKTKYLSTSQSFFSNKASCKGKTANSIKFKNIRLKKEDMYILSNHFNAKLNHLDQLSNKELEFQKMMLKLKHCNHAIHHNCDVMDLSKIEEDARKSFMRLKFKASPVKKHYKGYISMMSQTNTNIHNSQNKKSNIGNVIKNSFLMSQSNSKGDIRKDIQRKFSLRKQSQQQEDIGLLYKKNMVKMTNNDKLNQLDKDINDLVNYMDNIRKSNGKKINTKTRNQKTIKASFSC